MIRCALALILAAGSASAEMLLCLGTRPGFMFVVTEGDRVAFDYLGDGEFGLDPPAAPLGGTYELVTARERWPVFIEPSACEVIGLSMPLSLTIDVPTSAGMRPLTGCCRWRTEASSD